MIAREPAPEDVAVLSELIDQLMNGLLHQSHKDILTLSLQGFDSSEIADQTGRSGRTVRRVFEIREERS